MAEMMKPRPTHTIFYSWQSDLPNATNRSFIQNCLEKAIKQIKSNQEYVIDPCIDRDTNNVPGSPNIVETIFSKIEAADIFVVDVSFIAKSTEGRLTPNPNALIELGYASKCLGWENVLCILNDTTGRIEDLPFDIRQRRIIKYTLAKGEAKSEVRNEFVRLLLVYLVPILQQASPSSEIGVFNNAILIEKRDAKMVLRYKETKRYSDGVYMMKTQDSVVNKDVEFEWSDYVGNLLPLFKDGISKDELRKKIVEYLLRKLKLPATSEIKRTDINVQSEEYERFLALLEKEGVIEGPATQYRLTDAARKWYLLKLTQ